MGARHPAEVAAFVKEHARSRLTFHGSIASYDSDEHEVTFDWRTADSMLAGEDAFDDANHVPLGFLNEDLPLFVDLRKAGVFALMDGEQVRITADLFIMNVTLAVPCLDTQVVQVPDASIRFPRRMPPPGSLTSNANALAVVPARVPSAAAFFRPAEYPEAILANRAMVDRLRDARFSGVDFVPLAQHEFA